MKNLTNFYKEARFNKILEKLKISDYPSRDSILEKVPKEWLSEYGRIMLHFKNVSTCIMFFNEMLGQISDGKYENSSPHNHWEWLKNIIFDIDGNEFYTGFSRYRNPKKKYNLREWVKAVKEILAGHPTSSGFDFAIRLYDCGKLGKCLEDMNISKYVFVDSKTMCFSSYLRYFAETYGNALRKNPNCTYAEATKNLQFYIVNAFNKFPELDNEDFFEKFKNTEYTFNEFKEDVKSMENTVNILNYD